MPGTLPLRQHDLVICDIDGCLVSESAHPFDLGSLARITEHNRLALARGDRPLLTLCSGRPQPFAESLMRMLANLEVPCICENGVWLYHAGTNTYEMDPRITPEHLHAVHELSEWAAREFGPRGVTEQPGKAASVTLYHRDTEFLRGTVAPAVEAHVKAHGWPFRVSMTWFYINCDLAHVSKGTGIDRLLATLRIPKARLAGVGDTMGDACIADRVGFFACPQNAHPAIKERAHYISPEPEARGVVDILAQLTASG
jgi:hydroxymethylpyrimidine pyrophosphatase-like HAD family hydrolase